jgi:hypothetical protein
VVCVRGVRAVRVENWKRDETGERDDGRREGGSSCSSSRAVGVGLTTAGPVFARMSGMFGAKV